MQLVRRGEASAFEVVYERHSSAAFSLAYRMCGSRSAAEDVVQEAFLSLWRSGARYDRARGSVRTWVLGIVHNRAIDSLRRSVVHDRRRASDEGIEERFEAKRPHRRRGRAPRRGAGDPRRAADAAGRAVPRHRARLLRRLHADRDRLHARHADRHGQGAHAPRPGEDARPARRPAGGHAVNFYECPRVDDAAGYVLRALPDYERGDLPRARHAVRRTAPTKVAELGFVSDALLSAVPQLSAPPDIRDRVMSVVRAEAELLQAAGRRRRPAAAMPSASARLALRLRPAAPAGRRRAGRRRCSRSGLAPARC